MSNLSDSPRRIAFVLNALTKDELIAGNRDAARVYSLLTDPRIGDCSNKGPPPIHACQSWAEFFDHFNTLLETWNITDQLIFYFSGHGEIRRGVYGLRFGPSKSDFYPFKNFMNDLEAGGVGRAIIILDTCHSGAAVQEKSEHDPLATIEQQTPPQGIAIIASSRSTEGSRELPDGSNSVFTELFCEGIETGLEGNKTPDGMIYVGDIIGYITGKLISDDKYKAFHQRPVFSVNAFEKDIWVAKNKSGRVSEQVSSNEPRIVQNPEELLMLYERTAPTEHPCPNATLVDLDWTLVANYAKELSSDLDAGNPDEAMLSTLKFFSSIPYDGRICLHQSAVLCFAHRPETMYSQAKAIFVVGNPRDKDFIREDITGPLSVQVEQLVKRIFKELPRISSISESGLREERSELDFELVRELISNAITHRDYAQQGAVKVTLKPNVLEIQSPGKFPDGVSWQDLLESAEYPVSLPVNGAIAQYLSKLLGFEGIGRGFDIIRSYIQQSGPESVEFKALPGPTILVRVRRQKSVNTAPPLPNLIIGREDDIAALEQQLTGETETILLTAVRGWPGIGKTTLAAALAHDDKLKDTFSDGVLWISLGQEPDIRIGLGDWLRAMSEDTRAYPTPEASSQRLVAILRHRKMLLVIDDVWEAADAQPFLVGGTACRTLITTREPKVARDLGLPDQAIYKLLVLSEEASLELLSKIAPSVVENDPKGVKTLVNELEGLPLALHVAGRLLVEEAELGLGISELLAELAEGVRILEEQAPADRTDLATQTTPTVAALFKHSTDRLDEETHERFALLGIFVPKPATFDAPAIAAAWGVDDPRPTLRSLLARGLIEPSADGRFQMHALLAMHAKSLWIEDTNKESSRVDIKTLERLAQHYLETAHTHSSKQEFLTLDAEWPQIRELLEEIFNNREPTYKSLFLELVTLLSEYWTVRGMAQEALVWFERGVEISAETGNLRDQSIQLGNLGNAYYSLGNINKATVYYQQTLDLTREIDDRSSEAVTLGNLGSVYSDLGQTEQAIKYYQQALTITSDIGDRQGESNNLGNLGLVYRSLGQIEQAINCYQQALAIAQEIGDRRSEGNQLANLGLAYHDLGQTEQAVDYYEQALTFIREIGDRLGEAAVLGSLGLAYHDLRQIDQAIAFSRQALTTYEMVLGLEDPKTAQILNDMGFLLRAKGDYENARSYIEQALAIREKTLGSEHPDIVQSLNNLAFLLDRQEDYKGARLCFERALAINQELLGLEHPNTAISLNNLGALLITLEEYANARSYVEQAMVIREKVLGPSHPDTAVSLYNFGVILEQIEGFEVARPYFERALSIWEKVLEPGHPDAQIVRDKLSGSKDTTSK